MSEKNPKPTKSIRITPEEEYKLRLKESAVYLHHAIVQIISSKK